MDPAVLDQMLSGIPRVQDANLVLGYAHKDDATVYRLPSGELIVQTVDFFTPVVDDPYDYGQIAAANSLSDIYAMNGRPLFALNIACFPKSVPVEVWREVLRGGAEKAAEAGIAIAGGHTIDDAEPKYGLVVTGVVQPGKIWANEGAKPGDALILTKALGTGLVTTLLKSEYVKPEDAREVIEQMKLLNKGAAEILSKYDVHACTDITGFGFLGHGWEMCEASRAGMEIALASVPFLPTALAHIGTKKYPGGTKANRLFLGDRIRASAEVDEDRLWLLYDAQTSGGLLAALPQDQANAVVAELRAAGLPYASVVGRIIVDTHIRVIP